jgi:hypothetical protein
MEIFFQAFIPLFVAIEVFGVLPLLAGRLLYAFPGSTEDDFRVGGGVSMDGGLGAVSGRVRGSDDAGRHTGNVTIIKRAQSRTRRGIVDD